MEVIISKPFVKKLKLLPKTAQQQIAIILEKLAAAKNIEDTGIDYKKLAGSTNNFYRIRVGMYRIGAKYILPDIIIITVGQRGDFYKYFPPQ